MSGTGGTVRWKMSTFGECLEFLSSNVSPMRIVYDVIGTIYAGIGAHFALKILLGSGPKQ
jgi:hypothetical protein